MTRRVGVFLRHCRRQADLYGAKGARVAAARRATAVLAAAEAEHGAQARLERAAAVLEALAAEVPHVALADVEVQPGGRVVRHLDLCGRKTPYTASLRAAREAAERVLAGYGRRVEAAERCDGVDWKALSHAVRVGREAVELLSTGQLRFPLVAAGHLLAIKLGLVPYDAVEAEVEALRDEAERTAERLALPDEPDRAAAEALVLRAHRRRVLGAAHGTGA